MTKIYVVVIDRTTHNDITNDADITLYDDNTMIRHGISTYWDVPDGKEYTINVAVNDGHDYYSECVYANGDDISTHIFVDIKEASNV